MGNMTETNEEKKLRNIIFNKNNPYTPLQVNLMHRTWLMTGNQ